MFFRNFWTELKNKFGKVGIGYIVTDPLLPHVTGILTLLKGKVISGYSKPSY